MKVSTVDVSMFLLPLLPIPPPCVPPPQSLGATVCSRGPVRWILIPWEMIPQKLQEVGGSEGEISFLSRMLFWALCFKASQCLGTLLQVMMQKWSLTIAGGAFWWPPKFLFFPPHWFCCELSARPSLYQSPCKCKLAELQISWNSPPSQEEKKKWRDIGLRCCHNWGQSTDASCMWWVPSHCGAFLLAFREWSRIIATPSSSH